jgi:hypothetical protein
MRRLAAAFIFYTTDDMGGGNGGERDWFAGITPILLEITFAA